MGRLTGTKSETPSILLRVNNNKVQVLGDLKIRNTLYRELSIKHPRAFHMKKQIGFRWDGMVHFMTDSGFCRVGLLPFIIRFLEEEGVHYEIEDNIEELKHVGIPRDINGLIPRPYQAEVVKKVISNKIGSIKFPKGIIDAATNAGKTLISVMIYRAYNKIPTLLLINDKDLFNQFMVEIPRMVDSKEFGYIQGKNRKFSNFTVAMVQTLTRNRKDPKLLGMLAKFKVVLVDECDLAGSKTYQFCLENTFNAPVRIGLSGSPFGGEDPIKHFNLRSWFGDVIYKITKKELVELGVSTKPVIKITKGSDLRGYKGDYDKTYRDTIILDPVRNKRVLGRLNYNIKKGRLPILVVAQYIEHVEFIYNYLKSRLDKRFSIKFVHHETKERKSIFNDFRDGKIDILISSMIVKRGKNLPLIKVIINVGGGKSENTVVQIMGRGERKDASKDRFYLEDFFDKCLYMMRHSKRRIIYYKRQEFKVMELYK